MKGSGQGVPQATFPTTKTATLQTASWTVPTVLPAGGNNNDYWIKITTTGSLRPPVIGKSSMFTITGVTAASSASLTINSNANKASLIEITNTQGLAVQPGFTTSKTFSLAAGTYYVKVSRSCTIPMTAQTITLGSGGSLTKTYLLTDVSSADCANGKIEFGSIDITSTPNEKYEVYIKPAAAPASQYITKGTNTPTIENVAPGVWTVKLEPKDGYAPAELTVTVPAEGTVNADFVLEKIPDVTAKVLIVPQPLNIGRTGYFVAFVALPTGYKAADVDAGSVYCENKKALKLVRINLFPQVFAAIFNRENLAVTTSTKTMKVLGTVKKNGVNVPFSGSSSVTIINKKVTTKEDIDSVLTLPDQQVFIKFYK
jgi:hypothetical protein